MYCSEKEFKELCKKMNIDPKKYIRYSKNKKQTNKKEFDSVAEEKFYNFYVLPNVEKGRIKKYKLHDEFVIIDAIPKYKLKSKKFKPDFIIETIDGRIIVVEMKGTVVKKLQRDYGLRKHLFIEKFCIPNNWEFIELKSEQWTQETFLMVENDPLSLNKDLTNNS